MRLPKISSLIFVALVLTGCGLRGPRGHYVQKEDSSVYIDFIDEKSARSNVVKEFADAEFDFWTHSSVFSEKIRIYGPRTAPEKKKHKYDIVGEGKEIRVQDLSALPGPDGVFPITHYTRIVQ